MSRLEIAEFFGSYRDAFNRFDGDAVADLWHSPSAIWHTVGQGVGVTAWAEDARMRDNHRALCEIYAKRPPHLWSFDVIEHSAMGEDQAFAKLKWTATQPGGAVAQHFHTGYLLIRTSMGIRVAHCMQYEERSEKRIERP